MPTYRIFKRNSSRLKMLTPLADTNVLKCAKLVTNEDVTIGYDNDCDKFLEIHKCPRIYLGMIMECKNMEDGSYDNLGELVDLQYSEGSGYLFIFK